MSINNSQQISDIKTMLVKGMNGEGIESIEKTATEGFIDTYTITYTDGTKTTFDVTNGNWGIWTSAVTAAQGATSVTINNDAIGTTSILEVYSQNASGTVITVNDIDVGAGSAVLTFPALAEATSFILHIVNGTSSGGGGATPTNDYLDLDNKPQINGHTLTGNKTASDLGLLDGEPPASGISYDNTTSGLTATDVQEAVDEVANGVSDVESNLVKVYNDSYTTTSIAPNTTKTVTVTLPPSYNTILAVIPYSCSPNSSWESYPIVKTVTHATGSIEFRIVGSGSAQTYTIRYTVLYK